MEGVKEVAAECCDVLDRLDCGEMAHVLCFFALGGHAAETLTPPPE